MEKDGVEYISQAIGTEEIADYTGAKPIHKLCAQVMAHRLLHCRKPMVTFDYFADAGCWIFLQRKTLKKESLVAVDICRPTEYIKKAFVELLFAIHGM